MKTNSQLHIPVLLNDIIGAAQAIENNVARVLDVTAGRGGHLAELMKLFPNAQFTALDQDRDALDWLQERFVTELSVGKLDLIHGNFRQIKSLVPATLRYDFILADLGVSSPQLDQPERGFSFYNDGPLDMRMDQSRGETAQEIVASRSEDELIEIFQRLGEIQSPYRVVRAIVNDRKIKPFLRTIELSSLIERIDGWHKKGHHPATRYFLALRLLVNQELDLLPEGIASLIDILQNQGRLAVITFHSTEDRIVKNLFKDNLAQGKLVNKKVIQASWHEQKKNPRARSAKLRIFCKHVES